MNDTKEKAEKPVLLSEIMKVVEKCEKLYNQRRVYVRVMGLVLAELMAFGRHTITQLLLVLGNTEDDWSAWYRVFSKKRYDEAATSEVMVKEMLAEVPVNEPFVVGMDGFHVPRCSQTMPGTGWMRGLRTAKFKPGIQRGQRFVEGSWLTPVVNGFSRAIPFRCLSAFTAKAVASAEPPRTEVAAALVLLTWLRNILDAMGRGEQWLVSLHDGSYDTLDYWWQLPKRTIGIVRTACNRALYALPDADAHGNARYGDKAPAPKAWLKERKGFQQKEVMVRGVPRAMRYRLQGPYLRDGLPDTPLFLLVIGGGKRPPGSRRKQYDPCFFLISAIRVNDNWTLPLPLIDILTWLWQRWELEVAHRQMKSGLGLGEKQCWNQHATLATVQWSVWVYSLMMLAGYRMWGNDTGAKLPGAWQRTPKRWSFNTLWRQLRIELWQHPDFRATWSRSHDNWLQNEPLWDNLFNAIIASART
jgi:hypothetical protein